ncbi:MAG: hypothetical protein K2G85_08515 [Muribaculaceae bacterium]|nr:hypothetical protein [Muribaculaceae bacterium]
MEQIAKIQMAKNIPLSINMVFSKLNCIIITIILEIIKIRILIQYVTNDRERSLILIFQDIIPPNTQAVVVNIQAQGIRKIINIAQHTADVRIEVKNPQMMQDMEYCKNFLFLNFI